MLICLHTGESHCYSNVEHLNTPSHLDVQKEVSDYENWIKETYLPNRDTTKWMSLRHWLIRKGAWDVPIAIVEVEV